MAALPKEQAPRIPDDTVYKIRDLEEAVTHVKRGHTPAHVAARMKRVYRIGAELKTRSDELVQSMDRGDAWLKAHEGHEKYIEREGQWLCWLAEYQAIEDALQAAAELDR